MNQRIKLIDHYMSTLRLYSTIKSSFRIESYNVDHDNIL